MADLSDLAAQLEPELARTFLAAVEAARNYVSVEELEAAFEANRIDTVIILLERAVRDGFLPSLAPYLEVVRKVVQVGAVSTAVAWPLIEPGVLLWINANAGKRLVEAASLTQQGVVQAVRDAVRLGHLKGQSPKVLALAVREAIGLHPRYATALERYGDSLKGVVPEPRRQELIALYSQRLKSARAKTIARTETLQSINAGQYLAWQHQLKTDLLLERRTWLRWVTHEDDRTCPYCAAMDGREVPLRRGGPNPADKEVKFEVTHVGFPAGYPPPVKRKPLAPDPFAVKRDLKGRFAKAADPDLVPATDRQKSRFPPVLHPPLHPNCRCNLVLVFKNAEEGVPVVVPGSPSSVQVG